ncbi:MAG TPA: CBS domain-containing protein [Desulfurivibrionaceae bacterium]|nr:CBS domain-containing protein [Desulfurivibrionaceae bacterium]
MNIGEMCNREVIVIEKSGSIVEAAKLMRQYHVGDLVVIEKRQNGAYPLGIITDRDIVIELVAGEVNFEAVTVGDVMSGELLTAREEDEVAETIKRMRGAGVRRVPVVNQRGRLEGVITMDDMIDLLAELLEDLVALVGTQSRRERRKCVPVGGEPT